MRYRDFADQVRASGVKISNEGSHVTFRIPMPKSWSKLKKGEMKGAPHTQRGDIDNYLKALLDALYKDDSGIWDIRATKIWAYEGGISVEF